MVTEWYYSDSVEKTRSLTEADGHLSIVNKKIKNIYTRITFRVLIFHKFVFDTCLIRSYTLNHKLLKYYMYFKNNVLKIVELVFNIICW